MAKESSRLFSLESIPLGDAEAINHLKQAIAGGRHWYLALLGAMGLWTSAEEFITTEPTATSLTARLSTGFCWRSDSARR